MFIRAKIKDETMEHLRARIEKAIRYKRTITLEPSFLLQILDENDHLTGKDLRELRKKGKGKRHG